MAPLDFIIVQHEEHTTPGSTILWLEKNRLKYRVLRPDCGDVFPDPSLQTAVVICGGIPNVDEDQQFPWLVAEKRWIAEIVKRQIPVVGLCLGAQLLAHVMGTRVFKSPDWEYGWQSVDFTSEFRQWSGVLDCQQRKVFQCHGYQFHLPAGMTSLGSSQATSCQGFYKNRSVLAFQFHPEVDAQWIKLCVEATKRIGPYCEPIENISNSTHQFLEANQVWYFGMLNRFFGINSV
ncbi:MAG: type 1 glutamine amidotransferase [Bdellovibrionaceae bacterium]|nr:type 1 glutamine amidotransferase [Pseudobdellovibrionaceae bacterium]